jgi:hypothetical protein
MMRSIALVLMLATVAAACGDPSDDANGGGGATRTCVNAPCETPEPAATFGVTPTPHTPVLSATITQATITSIPSSPIPGSGTGTLEGYVHIGPTCPVVREGEDCDDRPHEADLDVFDANGGLVTTVSSDADGNFTAALAAGDYRLVPRDAGRLPYAGEQAFTIRAGEVTEVDVAYDSGIR